MNTSLSSNVQSPRQLPAPQPHLPLRRASSQRLHAYRQGPRPLFAPQQHQLRGFNPSPVEPLPRIDNATASSEHAFAGRDERSRRPFRPPLGVQELQRVQNSRHQDGEHMIQDHEMDLERPPSSPISSQHADSPREKGRSLRPSKSLGDGLRGLKNKISLGDSALRSAPPSGSFAPDPFLANAGPKHEEVRASVRSALTGHSSFINTSSINTDQSSVMTANSSTSEFVQVYPKWPATNESKESFDVEDAIGMYEDGFESVRGSMDVASMKSFGDARPASAQRPQKRPNLMHRRSQSASLLDRVTKGTEANSRLPSLAVTSGLDNGPPVPTKDARSGDPGVAPTPVPRDRYGFKKASHHINVQQYDAWERTYNEHMDRRRKKWNSMMKSYGLTTDKPIRFPPKSDKVKRYVRKGIPPEWRGAAWFWYAGGPGILKKEPNLYRNLLEKVEKGELTANDREHIERDLNRTFPDNIRFKPDEAATLGAQGGTGGGSAVRESKEAEQPVVRSLRRVLQAFAVHSPSIGYCQSLNFIAGLLLLFLDQDEEKAFILLNLVTSVHLPGTHGITLEGANIDIGVLMTCIRDALPAIWTKLDDKGGITAASPAAHALRLPTVSLATTAWFMSLFVGTLPIEAVLRVWDCLFFEGSKTLFRIALAIFKAGERDILAVSDPMEIFQVVQTIPRSMLDINALMDVCFRRRGGFGHVSQDLIERRRGERRMAVKAGIAEDGAAAKKWKSRWRSKTTKA